MARHAVTETSALLYVLLAFVREWRGGHPMDHFFRFLLQPSHLVVFAVLGFLLFGSIGMLQRRRGQ